MDQHVRYILPLIFSLAFAQQVPPEMKYLRGVPRLNNESFMDYYFTCSTVGQIHQWRVIQDVFGFIGGETTGTIKTCTGTSNLQCITTLLSSQSSQAGLFTFHSVLIVSTTTSRNIFNVVTCGNEINSTSVTINNTAIAQNVILNRISQNVLNLQYLFSANIVNDSTTSFYLCGVNDVIQAWQTNGLPYVFMDTDAIGQGRTFLSADETVAVQQTILMGREPYSLISILLLSIPYVNVTCASSQFRETLSSSEVQCTTVTTPPTTALPTTAPPTTAEIFTTPDITNGNDSSTSIGTTKNTEQASDTVAIIASVLGVIIFLFIVVVLPALIIVGIRCYRIKRGMLEVSRVTAEMPVFPAAECIRTPDEQVYLPQPSPPKSDEGTESTSFQSDEAASARHTKGKTEVSMDKRLARTPRKTQTGRTFGDIPNQVSTPPQLQEPVSINDEYNEEAVELPSNPLPHQDEMAAIGMDNGVVIGFSNTGSAPGSK